MARKGLLWRLAHSWWIVLLFTLYFSWVAFVYIGIVARRWRWIVWGIIYTPPFLVDFIFLDDLKRLGNWQFGMALLAGIAAYIGSIIHGLIVWRTFLRIMEARALGVSYQELLQMDLQMNSGRTQIAHLAEVSACINVEPPGSSVNAIPPAPNRAPSPPAPNQAPLVQPEPSRETKVIDLNTATESELADLPGVGAILAKKAIQHREASGGFHTVDEFFETLRLPPHAVVRLRPLVTVKSAPRQTPPSPHTPSAPPPRGRVVDY